MDDELAAHDAVRLCVAAALESSGFPQIAHLRLKARNDRSDMGFFVGDRFFLCNSQTFVRALAVDQPRGQPRERIAQNGVERRTEERVEPTFQMHEEQRQLGEQVQNHRTGVGARHRTTDVRIQRGNRLSGLDSDFSGRNLG